MTKLEELKATLDNANEAYQVELNKSKVWSPDVSNINFNREFYIIDYTFGVRMLHTRWLTKEQIMEFINCGNYFTLDQLDIAEKEADRKYEDSIKSAYVREHDPDFDIDERMESMEGLYFIHHYGDEHYTDHVFRRNAGGVYMSGNVADKLAEKLNSGEVSFKRNR